TVKFTLGLAVGEISRASRSRSPRVLRGRFPALVTIRAGLPLSVTTKDWPERRAFNTPGEWKNSRVVNVFILSNIRDGHIQCKQEICLAPVNADFRAGDTR